MRALKGFVVAAALAGTVLPGLAQIAAGAPQATVAIEAHLQAVDPRDGTLRQADFADARSSAPFDVGLSLALPEGPADAQGRAAFTLLHSDAQTLSFEALADIATNGHGDGTLALSGFGRASVRLLLPFTLAQPHTVWLTLASRVTHERDDDLGFALARADGTPLWQQTVVPDAAGLPGREFVRSFVLDAGDYRIAATLDAAANFDDAAALAGRTTLGTSISLVPEPTSAALLGAGLVLLGVLTLLRRRTPCPSSPRN